jgi:phosphoribosylamine--glycine ligase
LEGSKGFTKDICAAAGIPTAGYFRHDSKASALSGLDAFQAPYVIKADGLAAGKGVIIAETRIDAEAAIEDMFGGGFGDAGASVVIEEFMTGEEASFFALTDGRDVVAFGSAQDHKRVGDGDIGPNTGGMGAYSPAIVLTPALQAEVMDRIIKPTVDYMAAHDMPYSGVLFAGLMLTDEGPKLIEYNARFGDPECQVLMTRFDGDLAALMLAVATGKLSEAPAPSFSPDTALTVVMAANGYPDVPQKGGAIDLAAVSGAKVFHAGTAEVGGQLVAAGGRVLNVTATGANVTDAQAKAYAAVDQVIFPDGFCRRDIGWREVAREAGT